MIRPEDLQGVEENLARRVISTGRSIAPCLDTLEGEPQANAVAILLGIATEARGRGARGVKSQRIGPAQVEYFGVDSFTTEDKDALRALCSAATATTDGPVGSFPRPARAIDRLWPEYREDC